MAGIHLDRAKLADAVRGSTGFRTITRELEQRSVRSARTLAGQRTKRHTGTYEGNFEATFTPVAQTAVLGKLRLFNSALYALFIEEGTRPHIIRVRKARVLYNRETGQSFGKQVDHPGTRPQNVIRDALLAVANGRSA